MSRNVKNTKNSAPIQKFCKVCQDAGKSESEYRSHFTRETRDPNSRVVCPTLLALECRYCFKKGHTVKYCAVLKEKNRAPAPVRTEAPKKAVEKPKGKSNNHNVFAILDSDSEEEVVAPKVQEVKEEFPALSSSSLTRTQSVSANYAAALAKPAPAPETKIWAPWFDDLNESQAKSKAAPAPKVEAKAAPAPKIEAKAAPWTSGVSKASTMNWAAWDSDSEDDMEDTVPITTSNWAAAADDSDW